MFTVKVYIGENEDNLKCSLCRGAIEGLLEKRFGIGRKKVKAIFILCRETTEPYLVEISVRKGIKKEKSQRISRAVDEAVRLSFKSV